MFAPDGYSTIVVASLVCAAGTVVGFFLQGLASTLVILLFLSLIIFVVLFFRDPERVSPEGENLIIAPADGRIVVVRDIKNHLVSKGKCTQISIFLSLGNVHVNRVPVSGIIEDVDYFPGQFLTAWKEEASELNERAHFLIRHHSGNLILFKQITGLLARRIVYHLQPGDQVKAGDRFGLMKFGSRMDIIIPEGVEIKIQKGDRTVGGETILGVIQS